MRTGIGIAVTSDVYADNPGHTTATNEALRHAADALQLDVTVDWIPTETMESEAGRATLTPADNTRARTGLWRRSDSPGKAAGRSSGPEAASNMLW